MVGSDTPPTGWFTCSQPWLDQLMRNIDWGQRGNFVSVHVPSADPASVRDAHGGGPAMVGDYPGAPGAAEAVFEVASGSHEFSGPGLPAADDQHRP
ncbi:hypothetical protein [Actinoallomurus sp. CA-150999]|uniref:alpha-L-rhamnosidase-related protein n=1 Tax=Actinoallomurus sp. CA-150999 TaxID=3239887 RepID=UPI003D946A57